MTYTTRNIPFFAPDKIALSGQVFRFRVIDDNHTEVIAFGRYLQIASLGGDDYAFSCTEDEFESIWSDYLDLGRDYISICESIDPGDEYLMSASRFGYGIRILRQDVWETVISYIISQRRSIPSIMTSVDRISKMYGNKIVLPDLDGPFVAPLFNEYYSFPTAQEMSSATLADITSAGVGYRAEYIMSAINDFVSGKITEEMLRTLDDDRLYEVLLSMRGIGAKVANCIMLYGLSRCGRFPIDVWMDRIIRNHYNGSFDYSIYPETCGIMQQFMFYYERNK